MLTLEGTVQVGDILVFATLVATAVTFAVSHRQTVKANRAAQLTALRSELFPKADAAIEAFLGLCSALNQLTHLSLEKGMEAQDAAFQIVVLRSTYLGEPFDFEVADRVTTPDGFHALRRNTVAAAASKLSQAREQLNATVAQASLHLRSKEADARLEAVRQTVLAAFQHVFKGSPKVFKAKLEEARAAKRDLWELFYKELHADLGG